ncbi:MAG: pitrilysin family protein [Sulfuricurvum sp.]|uniref:M16 family metallopeptidase n=1 Tax=Sulfuricurvum sp. TaxID=2025608 RepID=UPI002609E97B|nr:pitrilysin family protein [Sulfuricurvum sp.]MDD2828979.1 pitrilysin family protein [Sulfuricurvum sp.]MDD4950078.1 pitrilysin family protein [Sulfuricurvum sp.]
MKRLSALFFTVGTLMASSLPHYETKTLDNGLQVVAIPMDNNSNVISTDIFYKVGSRNEVMGKSGIAHMLEHMNFKSTKNLKAGEFDEEVKSIGGMNNASTGFDHTHYYIKSSSENMGKSLSLFAELMQNLNLKDEEFQPERNVVAEERRWRTDNNPMGYLYFRLFNSAYIYHPYHWTPIGFMNDIQTWKLEDIQKFHATYYQPRNAILVVTGDIKADKVFEEAQKHFGSIANTVDIPTVKTIEPEQDGARRVEIHKESEVEMIALSFPIPNFQHADQPKLSALSELLSSGKSSRLYRTLVDEKRLVNQIHAYNMETIDPGIFLFLAIANKGVTAEQIEKELWKEIKKLQDKEVKTSELEKIKISTKSDFIYSLESSTSVAELFGGYLSRGDLAPLERYEEEINNLNAKELQRLAKHYFVSEKSTTIILRKGKK